MTTSTIIHGLTKITSPLQVLTSDQELETYGLDWTRFHQPSPMAIVLPNTVEQVVSLVKFANKKKFCIVPSGGRTGLSGGAIAENGEVVLSLEKMNKILDFNAVERSILCQAGVVTENIQNFAKDHNLYYPVDFASAGSSQIGGNIATNAGGIKVIKYGLTRHWISGLKVVTGEGDLLDLNQGLVKNASGYDLRHLFIGSEGTLGIVVEARVQLTTPPISNHVLVLGVPEFASMMDILSTFQSKMELSAFEFFSELALCKVIEHHDLSRPFVTESPFYALIELENLTEHREEIVMELFEFCMEKGWIIDGVMSQTEQQVKNLWALRERISETITPYTPYKNDISVTQSRVADFLADVESLINTLYPNFEIIWFGHIGDGNLHLNILKPHDLSPAKFKIECEKVNQSVYDIVQKHRGSISAEHGIGLLKKAYLSTTRSRQEISLMKQLKLVFDPNQVLNPGKLWDYE